MTLLVTPPVMPIHSAFGLGQYTDIPSTPLEASP